MIYMLGNLLELWKYLQTTCAIPDQGHLLSCWIKVRIPKRGMPEVTLESLDAWVIWQSWIAEVASCRDQEVCRIDEYFALLFDFYLPLRMLFRPSSLDYPVVQLDKSLQLVSFRHRLPVLPNFRSTTIVRTPICLRRKASLVDIRWHITSYAWINVGLPNPSLNSVISLRALRFKRKNKYHVRIPLVYCEINPRYLVRKQSTSGDPSGSSTYDYDLDTWVLIDRVFFNLKVWEYSPQWCSLRLRVPFQVLSKLI